MVDSKIVRDFAVIFDVEDSQVGLLAWLDRSQAIGAPAVCVEHPVPEAQQPERAAPATSRTMNLVSIVAPVWPPLKPVT